MKIAGVAIDDWKLDIFERGLKEEGYSYEKVPGISKGTLFLKVQTNNIAKLNNVLGRLNRQAANWKKAH